MRGPEQHPCQGIGAAISGDEGERAAACLRECTNATHVCAFPHTSQSVQSLTVIVCAKSRLRGIAELAAVFYEQTNVAPKGNLLMDIRCVLCDQPTPLRVLGAFIEVGDAAHPNGAPVCRPCAALPADERRRLRDVAMARMIRRAAADSDDHQDSRENPSASRSRTRGLRRAAQMIAVLVVGGAFGVGTVASVLLTPFVGWVDRSGDVL